MGLLFSAGLLALAGIGVPMNALFFQDGHHPAPLFTQATAPAKGESGKGESAKTETAKTETAKSDVAKTDSVKIETAKSETAKTNVAPGFAAPARPAHTASPRVDAIAAAIDPPRAAIRPAAIKLDAAKTGAVKSQAKKSAPEKRRDEIGQLIGGAPQSDSPDANVLSAQRALLKLGYVVRADGFMGGATRQAIEKYERDNGLPATGKVTAKLMKKLASESGTTQ